VFAAKENCLHGLPTTATGYKTVYVDGIVHTIATWIYRMSFMRGDALRMILKVCAL